MAPIEFVKYHGTGNDFILIDNRQGLVELSLDDIAWLCHRRLGIGADGLMMLLSSAEHDFEMKYYNADGREGSMCGNGGRCITAFASDLGLAQDMVRFQAIDGVHEAKITRNEGAVKQVEIQLNDVTSLRLLDDSSLLLDTGSPHYVQFVPGLDNVDALQEGKRIRWDDRFSPEGVNVNFVERKGGRLKVITYERGVENITLSCGTGTCATAVAARLKGLTDEKVTVTIPGGELEVEYSPGGHVFMSGPGEYVYEGTFLYEE